MTLGVTPAAFRATTAKLNASRGKQQKVSDGCTFGYTFLESDAGPLMVCGCISAEYSRNSGAILFIAAVCGCGGLQGTGKLS